MKQAACEQAELFSEYPVQEKVCTGCGETLLATTEFFFAQKSGKNGLIADCKKCRLQASKIWEKTHREQRRLTHKKWREKNLERMDSRQREWRKRNPEKIKGYSRKHYERNKEKVASRSRVWRQSDQGKRWYKSYVERERELKRKYYHLRKNDPRFKLNRKISYGISRGLKGTKKGRHWETLVDFDLETLEKHLQKKIPVGFTWADYVEGQLVLDHIIPLGVFNFSSPEDLDFKRCWSLSNLQLLPLSENRKKWDRLEKDFQPSFSFSSGE